MNDQQRAESLQIADEQMRQLNDIDWLKQHPAAEIEGDGWVEAGHGLQGYVEALKTVTPEAVREQKRQVRALSMLLPILSDWLESWQLGASFEAVYIEAQRLLFQRIQQASAAREDWIEELISTYEQGTGAEYSPELLRKRLAEILTQENWQALATVAAQDVEQRVLQQAQLQAKLPAAV